jgi:hypothetical protein
MKIKRERSIQSFSNSDQSLIDDFQPLRLSLPNVLNDENSNSIPFENDFWITDEFPFPFSLELELFPTENPRGIEQKISQKDNSEENYSLQSNKSKTYSTRFNGIQIGILNQCYTNHLNQRYPSEEQIYNLIHSAGLDRKQIRIFFTDKRTRAKK